MHTIVSIIIPMFNAEKYITETLNSILKQNFEKWECIVVDDGSTDSSKDIVLKFSQIDQRISYYYQANAGPSSARNKGFLLAKGRYIQFLDADDIISECRFTTLLNIYKNLPNRIILYSNLLVGDNDNIHKTSKFNSKTTLGRDINFKSMYKYFPNEILFIPGCILFPRDALLNISWDKSLSSAEDWDYYLQITKYNNYQFRNIPIILFYYRNSINSLSKNLESNYKAIYMISEKYRNWSNILDYCMKCGFIFARNLLLYRKKRILKLVNPISLKNLDSFISLLLFPISFFFTLKYFFSIKMGR